jgi:hypothetical protein
VAPRTPRIVFVIVCWFSFVFSILDYVWCGGSSAEFYLNRSSCGEASSCFIDCDRVESSKLWFHTERDAPPLSPGAAIRRAEEMVAGEARGASDVYTESLSLTRCGSGWVYIVRISASFPCGESDLPEFGTVAVGVFMDGAVFLPAPNVPPSKQGASVPGVGNLGSCSVTEPDITNETAPGGL